MFQKTKLATLNLASADIGAQGVLELSDTLTELSTLTDLDVSGNTMFEKSCGLLLNALEANKRLKLERLELSSNQIHAKGGKHVGRWLRQSHCTLVELGLKFNQLMPAGASAIAAALPSALYLKKLNLYQNHIGDDGCRALALALETNQVLEWLHIGNNDFGDDGVFTIAQCLRLQNNTLQFLDLSHNGITHLGEHHLRHALEKNQSVQKLMWGTTNVRDMRITVGFPKIRMGGI